MLEWIMGNIIPIIILLVVAIVGVLFLLSGLFLVRDNQVGILTKKMFGNKLPEGTIIAKNGEIGIQAQTFLPGLYWKNPITWKWKKVPITVINTNQIGIVESIDGQSLPMGRLLGDTVECNSYQDAKAFLDNNGKKGPQVEILRPGTYRINTMVFKIQPFDVIRINKEQIGVVVAQDGKPLPPGYLVAPRPDNQNNHNFYQDGQAFINGGGYRGTQHDTLQPAEYYINPLLFQVTAYSVAEVPPGYVAVIRSNVGLELGSAEKEKTPTKTSKEPDFEQPIHEKEEVILTMDKNQRGIWRDPIAPGKYNLNPLAYDAYPVSTSAVTIDWAAGTELRAEHRIEGDTRQLSTLSGSRKIVSTTDVDESDKAKEFFKFGQLRVTSKDGFQMEVDVRMIIRIRPQNAPFVIARFGSVSNLIEQIVHPLIDSSFRNNAGEKKAIEFVQERSRLQQEALEKAREEFEKYHVEAQNLLIAYIALDPTLLATQTNKEIAIQQQQQYQEQASAEEQRIAVQEKKARADKQIDVIAAKLSIDIATDNAQARRKQAEGVRDSTKTEADGESYRNREVGRGIADAYNAQADAIGRGNLAVIQALKEISAGGIKITPDMFVSGGGDSSSAGTLLINAWFASMLSNQEFKMPDPKKKSAQQNTKTELPITSTPLQTKEDNTSSSSSSLSPPQRKRPSRER
jgi:regulator of protease activity HflC (stomatin/prohibitin superfamily)